MSVRSLFSTVRCSSPGMSANTLAKSIIFSSPSPTSDLVSAATDDTGIGIVGETGDGTTSGATICFVGKERVRSGILEVSEMIHEENTSMEFARGVGKTGSSTFLAVGTGQRIV